MWLILNQQLNDKNGKELELLNPPEGISEVIDVIRSKKQRKKNEKDLTQEYTYITQKLK